MSDKEEKPRRSTGGGMADMMQRIENLEDCISKIAVLSGHGNHLKEFNIERWVPSKDDMKKRRD